MKLLFSPATHVALANLLDTINAEAKGRGGEVKSLVVVVIDNTEECHVSTAISGCDCEACMNRISRVIGRIGRGEIPEELAAGQAVH